MAMSDGKKYPWIKSIFGRKKKTNPAEGVYAGPEQMLNGVKPGEAKCVYAGPARPSRRDSDDVIDVYAGPEFFGGEEAPEEETAPEQETEKIPFYPPVPPDMAMCVYAGPEQMSGNYQPLGVYIPEDEWKKAANPDENDKV